MKNIDKKMNKLFLLSIMLSFFPIYSQASCNIINGNMYGDCSNVTYSNKSKGVIKVSGYKNESGIIDGATVLTGGYLYLTGISDGDIIVNKNAKLTVTGIVSGTIKNNGGTVEIEGDVESIIANGGKTIIGGIVSNLSGNGKIIYNKGAFVNNKLMK